MATKRMLVDATHPEETRIVVTSGNRLEEFDFESASRRQLRGNIYLAKVTRVEPSLQAAFVDYGGNRHGFLAFSEIHPDYYQIPVADREALLAMEAEANERINDDNGGRKSKRRNKKTENRSKPEAVGSETEEDVIGDDDEPDVIAANDGLDGEEDSVEEPALLEDETELTADAEPPAEDETEALAKLDGEEPKKPARRSTRSRRSKSKKTEAAAPVEAEAAPEIVADEEHADEDAQPEEVDTLDQGFDDLGGGEGEDLIDTRRKLARRYKIQEVIKRRQVMLVQVVKEERGNKGAALTTYLSLAGRYSVLMPNTARGGGISRKITNSTDRKRLKEIAGELDVPQGMGVILRTAGASRTKAEVKRDFEYLSRLWENVRTLTLSSTAPSLVYAEGSLIKRTIRDLYDKDIAEVLVAGDNGYAEARDFMKLIMPSHAKKVKQYKEPQQIFSRFNVEQQLDSMFSPQVTLPSGGYIVINPTEALVSIDVNSGRATREHNIEDTALQTNLEAADEVARQLRLRDMAGLIVIDFIDMTERRSIRNVEKRLKDALKHDRARIQVGRISHFGLLEMSRQRMRFGVLESSTHTCPMCQGAGIVRSVESLALMVMRAVEDQVHKKPGDNIDVRVPTDVALYLLNAKRHLLTDLEDRHGLSITVSADATLIGSHYAIDRTGPASGPSSVSSSAVAMDERSVPAAPEEESEDEQPKSRSRRRRRGRRSDSEQDEAEFETASEDDEADEVVEASETLDGDDEDQPRKRRRRGRRGGRRNRRPNGELDSEVETEESEVAAESADLAGAEQPSILTEPQDEDETATTEAKPRRRTRKPKKPEPESEIAEETAEQSAEPEPVEPAEPVPAKEPADEEKPGARSKKELPPEGEIIASSTSADEKPKRGGWWSRR
ncbi:MAG: ribonuclease E/G [Hyphomicrobiaceae bacterium]|nr:ribonuclease E/G [Hyphomicrobiaceae bacterium]MCC0023551.1 ribonuclease E/G [Hyphomicrobiaceae bacterium]